MSVPIPVFGLTGETIYNISGDPKFPEFEQLPVYPKDVLVTGVTSVSSPAQVDNIKALTFGFDGINSFGGFKKI